MNWNINKSLPICPQICEQICVMIVKKELLPKNKVFSVRELALKIGVNPNTVQKAYEILESKKIIYSVRGSGWYVGEDLEIALNVVKELSNKKTTDYSRDMEQVGYSKEEIKKYILERLGE